MILAFMNSVSRHAASTLHLQGWVSTLHLQGWVSALHLQDWPSALHLQGWTQHWGCISAHLAPSGSSREDRHTTCWPSAPLWSHSCRPSVVRLFGRCLHLTPQVGCPSSVPLWVPHRPLSLTLHLLSCWLSILATTGRKNFCVTLIWINSHVLGFFRETEPVGDTVFERRCISRNWLMQWWRPRSPAIRPLQAGDSGKLVVQCGLSLKAWDSGAGSECSDLGLKARDLGALMSKGRRR